ncbi:MAG TPA: thioesterase family protein [Ilumatobacteraceae bacterium]|jgi:carnitine 3-dehydrogenase|nr:thioesterase family protein [Ilumatobacteraceae bacterium]
MGSGKAQVDHDGRLVHAPTRWQPGDIVAAPLDFYRGEVKPEWVDYNRHMTEAAYLTAFGWASDALFSYIGDDDQYRTDGHSFYTVETHIAYLREAAENAPLRITTRVLGVDRKRLLIYHEMFHGDDGTLLATTEQMLVHVDMNAGRSVAILPDVRAALDAICAAHSTLAPAERAGHFPVPNPE